MASAPNAMPSAAYNLANVSQTFDYDLTLIKRVADSAQAIVLTVDQSNLFNTPLQENSEWYRCRYYNLYMHCQTPSYKPGYLLEIAGGEVTRKKAESYLHHEPLGCDSLGWHNTCEPITGYNRHLSDSAAMVHTINHRLRDAQDFSHNVSVLKEIVTLCAAKGTKLIVVSMPLSSAYRRHASATQVAMLRQTAEELVSAGAIYHDYGDDPRFTDADFHDSDHLDREGARRFTQILCDELLY